MDSLPHDLLATILAKLPLKRIATSKLVCKQWKTVIESKFFYQLFQSHHQNSHSLWSLLYRDSDHKEFTAHYRCNSWGLTGSLGSYISSFITSLFLTEDISWRLKKCVSIEANSDVGLMLFSLRNPGASYETYYVANPISREYVKIPPLVPCINWTTFVTLELVTQVANDVVLSYKVVFIKYIFTEVFEGDICLLIYSSETGLWSFSTILPSPQPYSTPISLNGNLYWIGRNYALNRYELVCHNFYAAGTESDRYGVILFPGVEENNKFITVCATSQESFMYIKIASEDKDDGSFEHKLSVWRLKIAEWQLVSKISPDFANSVIDDFLFTINPFDAKTVYFWTKRQKSLTSINLDSSCKIELHNNFECSSDGCIQKISQEWYLWEDLYERDIRMVFLPRWLYRIPCSPS